MILTSLIAGCTTNQVVTNDEQVKSFTVEQNQEGIYVVCVLPCAHIQQKQKNIIVEEVKEVEKVAKNKADQLLHRVLFDFDSEQLSPKELNELNDFINEERLSEVVLHGYTDDIGPEKYNKALAKRRIETIEKALKKMGVTVAHSQAYGKCCYINDNETEDGRHENRRVELLRVGKDFK